MHIPLFTFHFLGRVIVCVRYGINYAQKQRLGGKKSFTNRMRLSMEKKVTDKQNIVYLNLALSRDSA